MKNMRFLLHLVTFISIFTIVKGNWFASDDYLCNSLSVANMDTSPSQEDQGPHQRERKEGLLVTDAPVASPASIDSVNASGIVEIYRKWLNWNLCTAAYPKADFTAMNNLVPNNTIFLAPYPTFRSGLYPSATACRSAGPTRKGYIDVGVNSVFFPLVQNDVIDTKDDWIEGRCGVFTELQTLTLRLQLGAQYDATYNTDNFNGTLFAFIDGIPIKPTYIYVSTEYYFNACPNDSKKTYQEFSNLLGDFSGDSCDAQPFQVIDGLDAYPSAFYYGIDTRNWTKGETHMYEFGISTNVNIQCNSVKYILTAGAPPPIVPPTNSPKPPTKVPTTKSPSMPPLPSVPITSAPAPSSSEKCGLFGLGIFCILNWFKWLIGLFQ